MKGFGHYKYHFGQAAGQLRRVYHVPYWDPADPDRDNKRGLQSKEHRKYHMGQARLELRKMFKPPHWEPSDTTTGPSNGRAAGIILAAACVAFVVGVLVFGFMRSVENLASAEAPVGADSGYFWAELAIAFVLACIVGEKVMNRLGRE